MGAIGKDRVAIKEPSHRADAVSPGTVGRQGGILVWFKRFDDSDGDVESTTFALVVRRRFASMSPPQPAVNEKVFRNIVRAKARHAEAFF